MDFLLIAGAILLLSVALGLWRLSKTKITRLFVSRELRSLEAVWGEHIKGVVGQSLVHFSGEVLVPKRVYAGNSVNVELRVRRLEGEGQQFSHEDILAQDTASGKQVTLFIQEDDKSELWLEGELLAAAFTVAGERKQRQSLTLETLLYRWNCYFPNSGKQTFSLALRVISDSGTRELPTIMHTINVATLDHLTPQQLTMVAGVGAIAGFLLTVTEIGKNLHLFGLH